MTPTLPHAPGEHGEPPARTAPVRGPSFYALKVLKALASLQLTVVLFVLGILLVFFGTLAQLDNGIWTVVDKYFYSPVVWVPFELFHKFLAVFWKEQFPAGRSVWQGAFPFPAGQLVGGAMVVNLLAAHALRFRLTWKRSGIFLIHGGMLLLFTGEFITREFAIEQQMTIPEGGGVNFTEDTRNVELALIDRSPSTEDRVAVISQKRLAAARPGTRITHPDLPVDVEVVKFMKNSDFKKPGGVENPATAGAGLEIVAVPMPEEAGVETKQRGDIASAYVRLYKKGTDEVLGVYLVSLLLALQDHADTVKAGDATYQMTLRRARHYKPYRVHLDKFRFDRYTGTDKPKNYSSDVRVYDEAGNLVREQRIAMNEPLRYAGETFYQSSFDKTETTTVLQVVKNPGWLNFGLFQASIDYIACAVVGFGLVLHFGIYLIQFLMRLAPTERRGLTGSAGYLPWVALGLAGLLLLGAYARMTPRAHREPYNLDALARLPVVEGGRVKPLETVARVYLRTVSHRETFVDDNGDTQPAIRWYLDLISAGSFEDDSPAWHHKVFRIENDQVRAELKLPLREGLRYSLVEIRPQLPNLQSKAAIAQRNIKAKKEVGVAEAKMIELEERIALVRGLSQKRALNTHGKDTLQLLPPESGRTWESFAKLRDDADFDGLVAAQRALQADPQRLFRLTPEEARRVVFAFSQRDLNQLDEKQQLEVLVGVVRALNAPAADLPPEGRPRWLDATLAALPVADAARIRSETESDYRARVSASPAATGWDRIITAYRNGKPEEFNAAVAEYRAERLGEVAAGDVIRTRVEVAYNRFAPFYLCAGLYVFGFLLAVTGFVLYVAERPQWAVALRQAASVTLFLTLVVHTGALLTRMYIMERPGVFVTNLYSSAIFIGWGCVALCLVLERIFPIGVGNTVAAVLGLATTIVAHNLGTQDTLEMMEAVLDTNFWLATHVTTVTLGYTATFVAGFLGAIYILMMLGTVVRDSYESKGEPTVGALLAFGVAVLGLVTIPVFFLWFMRSALEKFELVHPILLDAAFWLVCAAGVMYGLTTLLLRVSVAGVDAHGKPLQGQVPALAQPVTALALTPESGKILGQMIYGVIAFATLLSFVGTVLGGIWADQSWGRFWGWDPKENGAVLIVLWNSLILHARWCGLVKDRGVAALAVFGNTVTAWSWFGTNQLGIGLHAYGFDSRLADGCFNFWLLQFVVLGCGAVIPRHFWASATRRAAAQKLPVAEVVGAAAPAPGAGAATHNESAAGTNGTVPVNSVNGHANGNGQSHRDKGKKHGKRR